jgi:putative DNA primase/helicase
LAKKYAGIPNDIARLKGARAAIASEVPEGRRLNESLIKDLTGGDTITARFLRKEFFEFRPESKLWLYGNYKPTITGSDEGIWRRINIIPFSVQISDADKNLGKKLNAEWPGILAWAVKGALEWQQQGLNPPPAVLTATSTYRREMDSIGTFLDKCCVINKEYKVSAKALYEAYKDWGRDGENLLSQRRLGERLSKKGLERKRGTGGYYWWRGIGLRDEYKVAN